MNQETIIGLSKIEKTLYWIIPPVLGAVLGWFLPVIADWVLTIPIVPFKGPLEFITSLNNFWVSIIAAVIGIVAGLFFSQYIFTEILQVFISDQNVKLLFKEKEEVIEKKTFLQFILRIRILLFLIIRVLNCTVNNLNQREPLQKVLLNITAINGQTKILLRMSINAGLRITPIFPRISIRYF